MSARQFSWNLFYKIPLVGILRGFPLEQIKELMPICRDGGLCNIEITMNSPDATGAIREISKNYGAQMNVGAGTVCSTADLESALDAGATFIITPIVIPDVIVSCKKRGVPIFPGAMTPTEIHTAWGLGADIVKVFPAGQLGPGFLKDIRGPLPQIKLMPTGGVTPETLPEFKRAGAAAFSVGSSLFDSAKIAAKDYGWVREQLKRFVAACAR